MARNDAYIEHLGSIGLFHGLSKRELTRIARAGDEVALDEGAILTRQGDAGREAFVIVEGTATVRRGDHEVATLGPGDTVGQLALLDHGPRTATVTADGPMTVFVLGAREFAAAIDDVPSLARKVLANVAGMVRELDSKMFS